MRHSVRYVVLIVVVLLLAALPAYAAQSRPGKGNASDAPAIGQRQDGSTALVQLKGDPLATDARTRPPQGKKVDFNSEAVRSHRAQLAAQRNEFKAWLRQNAPKARVTGEFDLALNAVAVKLNGESLDKIRTAPQVVRAEYQGLYYPTQGGDPDLTLINAIRAWDRAGGAATAGKGVKVAIIDSGIDQGHACFSDAGYPSQDQVGDKRFTNNKVIAAKVFNNKTPSQQYTPEAIEAHGTHVAGTVACNYGTPATVNGVTIPYGLSGVAPRALLGNYNVFPGLVESARSEDILNAMEAAYADDFDVANMSLSGGAAGVQDLLTVAVDNLDLANMVIAVASGNEGPGYYTVGSPGSAARALTAGASTVPHFVGATITANGDGYGGATGDFATVAADLTAPLAAPAGDSPSGLDLACQALSVDLSGQIVLLSRGSCTFGTKVYNAEQAGAVAAIIVNNVAGDPIAMGADPAFAPAIPAYMVGLRDGTAIKTAAGSDVTIGAAQAYFQTANANIMAGFSSQGPTDVDFRVKPDVVAPGVNVLSSVPDGGFAFYQGTSMATPHLAGSAAIVKQQHPDWTAAQIRSAIVNTADDAALGRYTDAEPINDANITSAGLEDLYAATGAVVALDPVSVSFGAVPSGAGQTKTFDLLLTDLTGAGGTFDLAATSFGVSYSVSPASVTVPAGGSTTVTVTMSAGKGAPLNGQQGRLSISSGGQEVAHAVLFTFVK